MRNIILKINFSIAFAFCLFNSFAQVFQNTSSFTDARHGHCTEQSIDDKVLIFGGIVANGSNINSVYEYDPTINLTGETRKAF
jgi:hypothetical protein